MGINKYFLFCISFPTNSKPTTTYSYNTRTVDGTRKFSSLVYVWHIDTFEKEYIKL